MSMKYYVDFCGTIEIKARNIEEVEDKFWAWVERNKVQYASVDLIEEIEENKEEK